MAQDMGMQSRRQRPALPSLSAARPVIPAVTRLPVVPLTGVQPWPFFTTPAAKVSRSGADTDLRGMLGAS